MRFKYYLRGAGIGVIVATLILSVAFLFQDNISDEEVIRRAMKLGMVMEENDQGTLADLQQPGVTQADVETGTDDGPNPDKDALSPDENTMDTVSDDGTDTDTNTDDKPSGSKDNKTSGDEKPSGNQEGNTDKTSDDSKPSNDKSSDDKTSDSKKPSADEKPSNNDKPSNSEKPSNNDKPSDSEKPSGDTSSGDEVIITIESGDVSRMVSAKVFDAGLVESADEFNSYLGAHDYDNKLQPGTHKIPKGSTFRQIAQILTTRQ